MKQRSRPPEEDNLLRPRLIDMIDPDLFGGGGTRPGQMTEASRSCHASRKTKVSVRARSTSAIVLIIPALKGDGERDQIAMAA